ncbi:hypothetical protein IEQ34_008135 [Dendrobium chrysotoxum]|uniref:Uncharacterized protein n=1 Tax=Dendrobium chrysotoxum TaxID=161865 RepID=A0AAV7H7H5_DENCH|nr:hypothetical protein IEQ34_008135 [Dendrobium chrysotoxum]
MFYNEYFLHLPSDFLIMDMNNRQNRGELPELRKADVTSVQPHAISVPIPIVVSEALALNYPKTNACPVLDGDSGKMILNDYNFALNNAHLGMGSLISPIIPPSEVVCVNNNVDSPLATHYGVNSSNNLDCDGDKMDNTDFYSGWFVVPNSAFPITDYDPLIERLDVSNRVPVIDLPISPSLDEGFNLDGGLQIGVHFADLVDHSDWMEEYSGNKCRDGDIYGDRANLPLENFDLNVFKIDKVGFSSVLGKKNKRKKVVRGFVGDSYRLEAFLDR